MGEDDFSAPSWTPIGQADYRRFMQIRVFDCWVHEQDVRDAVGRPGHEDGPVAEQAVDEIVRALGYIVGKKAGAPEGSSVTIELTGPVARSIHVAVDGRAAVVDRLPGAADGDGGARIPGRSPAWPAAGSSRPGHSARSSSRGTGPGPAGGDQPAVHDLSAWSRWAAMSCSDSLRPKRAWMAAAGPGAMDPRNAPTRSETGATTISARSRRMALTTASATAPGVTVPTPHGRLVPVSANMPASRTKPGDITETPMPLPRRSARNPPAKPRRPNLVAEYSDAPFVPTWPDSDDT